MQPERIQISLRDDKVQRVEANNECFRKIVHEIMGKKCELTKDDLTVLLDRALNERNYSVSYTKHLLDYVTQGGLLIEKLTNNEARALHRSFDAKKDRASVKSDQRYTFSEDEIEQISAHSWNTLRNACGQTTTDTAVLFSYIWLMMLYTGKRMSDISTVSRDDLHMLRENGFVAIRIPKSRKVSRIALNDELREIINLVLREKMRIQLPFDPFAKRRGLLAYLCRLYTRLNPGKAKPRGLGFHALRRRTAGSSYMEGKNIDEIREQMDHTNNAQTNMYINKHLLEEQTRKCGLTYKNFQSSATSLPLSSSSSSSVCCGDDSSTLGE